jgi:hypothetical protein
MRIPYEIEFGRVNTSFLPSVQQDHSNTKCSPSKISQSINQERSIHALYKIMDCGFVNDAYWPGVTSLANPHSY